MKRGGFSFLEALLALAVLATLSATLLPLMTGLLVTDRRARLHAEAWRAAQAGLTALYLDDPAGWKEIEKNAPFRLGLEPNPAAGGAGWNKMTVMPSDSTQAVLILYLESDTP
jgi:type II secretory pathway pseudopilin PulG